LAEPAAPLRILCVGAGYFASSHHAAWRDLHGAELVAIVDLDEARAIAAARGGERAFASLDAALAAVEVDLVDIATPPEAHLDLIDLATAAGCAVVCQKPFCGGLEGARRAVAMAQARHATLIVHENFRFQPWWRALRSEIDAGRLGDFYQISFRLRPGDGQGSDAYLARQPYFRTMTRFLVQETAVHFVDVFRFLMGEPDWVWADLRKLNPAIEGEDAGLIVLGWEDGRRAVFDGNRLADHPAADRRLVMGEALAEGARASVRITGDGRMIRRTQGSDEEAEIPLEMRRAEFGGGCVRALQAHVLDRLSAGGAPENAAEDYLRNLELVELIYRSHKEGTRVSARNPAAQAAS
jgi:predicted dehydrogenase